MHPALGAVGLLVGRIREGGATFYDTSRGTIQHYEGVSQLRTAASRRPRHFMIPEYLSYD